MPVKYIYTLLIVYGLSFTLLGQSEKADFWIKQADLNRETNFVNASLYCDSVFSFAKKTGNKVYLARAFNTFGNLQIAKGNYEKALKNFDTAQAIILKENNKVILANIINNKGICEERLGNYNMALKLHLQSLKLREELGIPKEILIGHQNIGVVYFFIGDLKESIKYSNKALEIALRIHDSTTACQIYDNLGATYFNAFKDSLALINYFKALSIAKELNYQKGIESVSNNLSAFYLETGRPELAKKYLKTAMEHLNENPINKISLLHNLGKVFEKEKRIDSAIYYFNAALELSIKIQSKHNIMVLYDQLSKTYFDYRKFDLAYDYKGRYHNLKDSLTNEKNLKSIAEIEAIYKTEKQGREIELLNAENKIQKESSENRKKLLWVSLGGLLLAIVAALAFYRNFINKKKDNLILQEKNIEIQKQKDLIAEKNKEIVDSINYAKRLQDAILPSQELIRKHFPLSFILFKPKDIVAGDFYWMHVSSELKVRSSEKSTGESSEKQKHSELRTQNYQLIAVADCTGHGVPGALVSVVCANALNTAVKEFGLTEPAKILDKVNELVEETFSKSDAEVKDGMDISLVKIEAVNDHPDNKLPKGKMVIPKGQSLAEFIEANKKYNIQWAGANNPLWFIKDDIWQEIKADKQPVGKFEHRKPFTNHTFQLKVNDSLFLISDGYSDQFGGVQGKKIKNKAVKEILFKNSEATPIHQKQILEKEFAEWKGNYDQVDDVTVMGIKF